MAEEKNDWHKILSIEDIFNQDDYIILTLPEKKLPMKFRPMVCSVSKKSIGLQLPYRWWQFFEFSIGMQIRLTQLHQDGVFYTTGTIDTVNINKLPNINIVHDGTIKRDQRRFFYRVALDQAVTINDLVIPEGKRIMNCSAVLLDISAGGIGLGIDTFLPPGTILTIKDLLSSLLSDASGTSHECQVIWCTVHRPRGYRVGACFNYPHEKEQDHMVRMINQVQRLRMKKYYHIKSI